MNVLLITADQWRADCLGCAGGLPVRTPAIDALARDAVRFARHHAQATPCGPSRASLLTGLYAFNHRSIGNGTPLDARHLTAAQIARRHGMRPLLFGYSDTSIDPRSVPAGDPRLLTYEGVAPGFEPACLLLEDGGPWLEHLAGRGHGRLTVDEVYATPLGAPALYAAEDSETAFLTDRFLDFLDRPGSDPWFAHLSYIKPHPPWIAAAPYNAMYEPGDLPKPRRAPTIAEEAARHPYLAWLLEQSFGGWMGQSFDRPAALTEAVVARLRAVYLGLVSELDHQLGRIFEALGRAGLMERTLVVLTADHAEMLGDHWLLGKNGFWPEAFHVPLILRHPTRQRPGRVVDAFTEHVDLMPTILGALGLPIPRQGDGHDLSDFLTGENPANWRQAAVFEHDFRDLEHGRHRRLAGVDDDSASLVVRRSADRLYVQFSGLEAGCWSEAAGGGRAPIDDPRVLLEEAQALLRHRMTKAERRLTGCLLTPDGVVGGYDPL